MRGDAGDPLAEIDTAMAHVVALFPPSGAGGSPEPTTVIVLQTSRPPDDIVPAICQAIRPQRRPPGTAGPAAGPPPGGC